MTTRPEAPAQEVETVGPGHDDLRVVLEANGTPPPDHDSLVLLWLKARARTIDFRHHELARTHWRKVWRSMAQD